MVREAAQLVDAGETAGVQCNMSKLLAADASWKAGDVCVQTHGGYGFATEFDIEVRKVPALLWHAVMTSCVFFVTHRGLAQLPSHKHVNKTAQVQGDKTLSGGSNFD